MFDFAPTPTPVDGLGGAPVWFIVQGAKVLRAAGEFPADGVVPGDDPHFLGVLDGDRPVWTMRVDGATEAPDGHRFVDLYTIYGEVGHDLWLLAGKAVQIIEWTRTHRICGRCGIENEAAAGERAMQCPQCRLLCYPRLSPAVIMAVYRDDEILLARGAQFQVPMFSTLAGFVEPGETLETAVRREIREEVGLEVQAPEYFGSQPWPFPNSLMLGFFAEYGSGDITPDPVEIVEANWYRFDDLPAIPPAMSIANQLIEEFVRRRTA